MPPMRGSGVPFYDPLDLWGGHESPLSQGTCHDIQVVHLEPIGRAAWMVAPGHKHDIAVPDRHRLVQRSVVGVDPLDAKPVARIQPVIVRLLQVSDSREIILVVPVARVGRPVARRRENLCHEEAVAIVLVLHGDIVYIYRVGALAALGERDAVRPDAARVVPPFPGAEHTAITQSVSAIACHSAPFGR